MSFVQLRDNAVAQFFHREMDRFAIGAGESSEDLQEQVADAFLDTYFIAGQQNNEIPDLPRQFIRDVYSAVVPPQNLLNASWFGRRIKEFIKKGLGENLAGSYQQNSRNVNKTKGAKLYYVFIRIREAEIPTRTANCTILTKATGHDTYGFLDHALGSSITQQWLLSNKQKEKTPFQVHYPEGQDYFANGFWVLEIEAPGVDTSIPLPHPEALATISAKKNFVDTDNPYLKIFYKKKKTKTGGVYAGLKSSRCFERWFKVPARVDLDADVGVSSQAGIVKFTMKSNRSQIDRQGSEDIIITHS